MFTTFYNETIRKTVIGFGSLFDDIFVQRFDSSGNLSFRCSRAIKQKQQSVAFYQEWGSRLQTLITMGRENETPFLRDL